MINIKRIVLTLLIIMSVNVSTSPYVIKKEYNIIIDYVNDFGLTNKDNLISFIKYVKTQSNRLDTDVGRKDIYYVIQTMFNRMSEYKVTWPEYFARQNVNNSHSIYRMKIGDLRPSFSLDNQHDQILVSMVYSALYGFIEGDLKIDDDVLYFHSFGPRYNRAPHKIDKLYVEARHRFYSK